MYPLDICVYHCDSFVSARLPALSRSFTFAFDSIDISLFIPNMGFVDSLFTHQVDSSADRFVILDNDFSGELWFRGQFVYLEFGFVDGFPPKFMRVSFVWAVF